MSPYPAILAAIRDLNEDFIDQQTCADRCEAAVAELTPRTQDDPKAKAFALAVLCVVENKPGDDSWQELGRVMVGFGRGEDGKTVGGDPELHELHMALLRRRVYSRAFHGGLSGLGRMLAGRTGYERIGQEGREERRRGLRRATDLS
ncbi:hypothetical protein HYS28_00095 [Candidatus Uhrbacteria bacterium]|nr:hypothetical protein [Candidatus Uhrbacteria bacterium]